MTAPLLATDGYKFSMAEAGWPLRTETFYFAHRKGGLQVVPFDLVAAVKAALPAVESGDWEFLASNDYEMGSAFRAAMTKVTTPGEARSHGAAQLEVSALPKFAVFTEREPIFSVTGPSALVSWLEPLALQWSYRIQVATLALTAPAALADAVKVVTCEAQKALVLETLDAVKVAAPTIRVDSEGYVERVRARVAELAQIVGSPGRLFEVGLRAASCMEQHLLALEGCKQAGLLRTSNVYGARRLGMVPVGTMGHEHVQRFGSDRAAFRAMIERRYQRSSFLLDTYDTITSGLPAAFEIIRERPGQGDSIRYDSGDKELQYRHAAKLAREYGIRPVQILEDSFDAALTRRFEALRLEEGISADEQVYGYGGYLVAQTAGTTITRDRVSAVYKLSQTGDRPTMKFGNEAGGALCLSGKQSIPGRPVVFRREGDGPGPFGIVGQRGEGAPAGYRLLSGAGEAALPTRVSALNPGLELSAQTRALVNSLSNWQGAA